MHCSSTDRGREAGIAPRRNASKSAAFGILTVALTQFAVLSALQAQAAPPTAWIAVTLVSQARVPLRGARISVTPQQTAARTLEARTDSTGRATLGPLPAGPAELTAARVGFVSQLQQLSLGAGDTLRLTLVLDPAAQELGTIRVLASRGDLTPEERIDRERIAARAPHDAADVLRTVPGTDVVRRGAIAFDPVVRGLRDTQIGVYVDAARTFPGGPAGMDTPMSHVDPAHVSEIEVLTGPYALTWGAGNLSAIRMTTNPLPSPAARSASFRLTTGYDGNLDASEVAGRVEGALGRGGQVRYVAGGAWRQGNDYRAGDGSIVPAGFSSREGRARLGLRTGKDATLTLSGAFQAQRDIDYPGRPLDADYFDTAHLQGEWSLYRPSGQTLRGLDLMAYVYDVDHLMDNDGKPTALPDPSRMPPFAVNINTTSAVRVLGGRAALRLAAPAEWDLEVGGDAYHADHDAYRTVDRRDNGAPVRRDLIWGGAWIRTAGVFARAERAFGATRLAVSGRVDQVRADTDSASAFFIAQHGEGLSSSETNVSGAITLRVPVGARWAVTTGLGSVVRTAEANERFSDRAAAKRAQTNAEFLGDPALRPERSTQADVWLEGFFPKVTVRTGVFVRRMDDYITIEATDLPRAQPGSAPPVFRFVNGRADYYGAELATDVAVTEALTLAGSLAYLHGQDGTLDEPALGVTPLKGDFRIRLAPPGAAWFLEQATHAAASQDRTAETRGEIATPGWTTVDLSGGVRLWQGTTHGVLFQGGVRNLFDHHYVHHLTALNAFGRARIPEPGRVAFIRLTMDL
jgi:iron complex outermembrane recepter protein